MTKNRRTVAGSRPVSDDESDESEERRKSVPSLAVPTPTRV